MDNSDESEAESQVPDSQKRFDFRLFKDQRKSYDPRASIRKQGQIAISAGAVRTYDLRKEPEDDEEQFGEMIYDYWTLYFDEDENVIGLRPHKREVEGAKNARSYETGEIQIAAKPFMDKYNIPYGETQRFDLNHDTVQNVYFIELL